MAGRVASSVCVAAAVLAMAGCASHSAEDVATGPYRTVRAEPRRDTDAAKIANQAGLDHLAKGELDKAAEAFGRALTADVEFGPAHNNLGLVYLKQKDWYTAAREFDFACKLMPRRAEPRGNLGLVYEEAGETDRAVTYYREAISLDGDNVRFRANLVRALMIRGERTDEVRKLLQQVIEKDARVEWQVWAKQQLSLMRNKPDQPN